MKQYRFKLGEGPHFRYSENGILYTANALHFKLDEIERAFDENRFRPYFDSETHEPAFSKNGEPVYYLPWDTFEGKADVKYITIDQKEFSNKNYIGEDLTLFIGRHYQSCKFYDCQIDTKGNSHENCRFIKCYIDSKLIYDCSDLNNI